MNSSIVLQDSDKVYEDVQLWYKHKIPVQYLESFFKISYVNYQKIPVFLLQSTIVDIYSNLDATEDYIKNILVKYTNTHNNLGVLYRSSIQQHIYIILFIQDFKVKGFILDYSILDRLNSHNDNYDFQDNEHDLNYIIDLRVRQSSVHAIEKVLEKKKRNKSTTPTASTTNSSNLEHPNNMVSKVILSGLRLRGMSNNSSTTPNEKIKLKEIYQMTYKSTQFALRKFANKEIKLADVQDIVEKLLQVFIDIETDDNPFLE